MTMTVTAQEVATGTGAACLGDPLIAVQWLARQARDLGEPLLAGQVIMSGALGPMRPVLPGAEVTAVISGLGEVSVHFSEE
jgi:2-keto-4-pentenoate hydratase